MEPSATPLVLTKLRVPTVRPRTILRARLLERLSGETAGLTVVIAPAGYGKTTLLATWARGLIEQGSTLAWYALDKSDNAAILFGQYLVTGLIQALGPLPGLSQTAQLLRASPEANLLRVLPSVINAIALDGRPCVIVLDDYHLINAPEVHSAVEFLLDHLPENLRLVIGSRTNPPLPLARLRARGQLAEIRAAHLRFQIVEAAQFLNEKMRLNLSQEGVAVLLAQTEGWAAGLQLAALVLQGDPTDSSAAEETILTAGVGNRYLAEYLLEEVVNRLPEDVQRFLLYTSLIERMCAPLCDALETGAPSAEAVLDQLEQANLFVIPLEGPGRWFRYHHLFRDFLRAQLKRVQPERIPALHKAACAWLASNNLLREAAYHAFQSHDWDFAAAFVEQHGMTMLIYSEIATIHTWCESFPEEVLRRRPMLGLLQCWAWVFSFRRENREKVERRLRQVDRAIAAVRDPEMALLLSEHAETIRTYLVMTPDPDADAQAHLARAERMLAASAADSGPGHFSALLAVGYAQMALGNARAAEHALLEAIQAAADAQLFFGVVESTFHLARVTHAQGRLGRAAEICRQALSDQYPPGLDLPALGSLEIALGCVLLEQNDLEAAEQQLLKGLSRIGWGMNPHYLVTGSFALFRLYEIQNRTDEASQVLDRLEAAWPDIAFCTRGMRITHALRYSQADPGILAVAADWLGEFTPAYPASPPGMGPFGAAELFYYAAVAWVRVQTATGNAQAAREVLAGLLAAAETKGLDARLIELTLLEAECEAADRRLEQADALMGRALILAQAEGFVRSFDQGPNFRRLLARAARSGEQREYAIRLLSAIGEEDAAILETSSTPGPLTERELEILRMIASGASNQEIADTLVITLGTVKSHMNHILTKLDAKSRTEAVARARGMGLL